MAEGGDLCEDYVHPRICPESMLAVAELKRRQTGHTRHTADDHLTLLERKVMEMESESVYISEACLVLSVHESKKLVNLCIAREVDLILKSRYSGFVVEKSTSAHETRTCLPRSNKGNLAENVAVYGEHGCRHSGRLNRCRWLSRRVDGVHGRIRKRSNYWHWMSMSNSMT